LLWEGYEGDGGRGRRREEEGGGREKEGPSSWVLGVELLLAFAFLDARAYNILT